MSHQLLTNKQFNELYKDFTEMTKEDLMDKYCVKNPEKYAIFTISIEFKRGRDYYEKGLITKEYSEYIKHKLDRNKDLFLGEVNGKHSDVTADSTNITIIDDIASVEKYIQKHGNCTEDEFYFGIHDFEECNEDDNSDSDEIEQNKKCKICEKFYPSE
jgi:hypothetical protein